MKLKKPLEVISNLKWATRSPEYLEKKVYNSVIDVLFKFQVIQGFYSSALDTYDEISEHAPKVAKDPEIERIYRELIQIAEGPEPFGTKAHIEPGSGRPMWGRALLRREFGFQDVNGRLDNIDLRCDRKHFTADAMSQVTWQIPESWGDCSLYVYGALDTTFTLVEY